MERFYSVINSQELTIRNFYSYAEAKKFIYSANEENLTIKIIYI